MVGLRGRAVALLLLLLTAAAAPAQERIARSRRLLLFFSVEQGGKYGEVEQRLLYDPEYKYDLDFAPAQRVQGTLATGHLQHLGDAMTADFRIGWFERDFVRGALETQPEYAFGAFTGERFRILGEDMARRQDTVAAAAPLPGFGVPDYSERTPWGVPAFFRGVAPRGEVAWNHYRELRGQADATFAAGASVDVHLGAEAIRQRVRTFHRVLAWLPAD